MKKLLSVVLCLTFIFSLIMPFATPAAATGEMELIYSEDFDDVSDVASLGYDPNARGRTNNANNTATLEIVNGRLKVSQTASNVCFVKILPSDVMKTYKRFAVEADLQIDSTTGAAGILYYWPEYLGTNSSGTNTYHTLQFRGDYKQFLHAGRVNDSGKNDWDSFVLKNLIDYGIQNVGLGTNHTIRVEADGSNVKAYIDGTLVSEVNNAVYYESPLCLMIFNPTVAYFDNIKVWGEVDTAVYYPSYLDGQVIFREDFENVADVEQLGFDVAARHKAGNSTPSAYPTISIDTQNTNRLKIKIDDSDTELYFYKFLSADALRGVRSFTVEYDLQIEKLTELFGLGFYWPEHFGGSAGNCYFSFQFRGEYTTYVNSGRSASTWFNYATPTLESKGVTNTGLGTSHRVKVEVDGTTVKSYVDGILLDTKTNAVIYDSPLFFVMWKGAEVYIDNIIVWAGTGTEPTGFFDYHGFSVRVVDPNGLRATYSVSKELLDATIAEDGYKVVEYGMILTQREAYDLSEGRSNAELLLADDFSERDNTGKVVIWENGELKGNIYSRSDDGDVYTAVLISIKDENLDKAYAFRAYCIIEDEAGERTVLYSMMKEKSIYDVAKLALADEDNGLNEEQQAYLQSIVALVEGEI